MYRALSDNRAIVNSIETLRIKSFGNVSFSLSFFFSFLFLFLFRVVYAEKPFAGKMDC